MNWEDRIAANKDLIKCFIDNPDEFGKFVAAILNGDTIADKDRPLIDYDTAYIYQGVRDVWKGRNYDNGSIPKL